MSSNAWLPADALIGPAVRAPIARAVRDWSTSWFGSRATLRLTELQTRKHDAADPGHGQWRRQSTGIWTAIAASTLARLRAKALDLAHGVRAQSGRETLLLTAFEERMISDLARSIEAALGTTQPEVHASEALAKPGDGICATVGETSRPDALRILISLDHVIASRTARLPPPRPRQGLSNLSHALGRSRLHIEARLGTAELRLEELQGLAPGDVLILDRRLDEPAEVVAAQRSLLRGRLDSSPLVTLIMEPQEQ